MPMSNKVNGQLIAWRSLSCKTVLVMITFIAVELSWIMVLLILDT